MRDDQPDDDLSPEEAMRLAADIVASFVSNNSVTAEQLPDLIRSVHRTITGIGGAEPEKPAERQKPAVAIAKSIHDDYLVCLEDGKKLKMLKRYLRSTYGMTPDDYRKRWNLPPDYPMVAPNYAARRSEFAKKIGLGRGVRKSKAE
jgi:predicted transcriptional regulator